MWPAIQHNLLSPRALFESIFHTLRLHFLTSRLPNATRALYLRDTSMLIPRVELEMLTYW